MSVPRDAATFGGLLRAHRLAAGLTQEALAERSGVSPRSIQLLEAESVRPRRATVAYLAGALGLSGSDREELESAAGARRPARRHPEAPRGLTARGELLAVPMLDGTDALREHGLVALARPTPTNVPWPVSSLIGRESDVVALRALIAEEHQRLVTLTGVGGAGKTRLAVQVAAELLDGFADGVWYVELAPASSPTLVPRLVAGALGVREVQDVPILGTLLGFLRRKRLLLVLDNCEHLIDACAALADRLLTACPDLFILATSREPLQIAGERRWQVQPLTVPDLSNLSPVEALVGSAAVRLFVERAQAIDATFSLTESNAASVAQVCARLDGIPLAIELAASRIRVLAVDQIAARLDDGFRVLAGGTRGGPTRQQTMQAALDWSYDLLTDQEQATFRTLSTFAGGFDLEAAERVCSRQSAVGSSDSLPTADCPLPTDVLDVLSRLVDKSLVVAERVAEGRRYRLLEPVRQYGQQLLLASGEDEAARERHAVYYASLAERATPLLRGPEQVAWLDRLETERDNVRAALSWSAAYGSVDDSLRLAVALTPYWEGRGYLSEGRRWLEVVLAAARSGGASPAIQTQALLAAGRLAFWQVDHLHAEALLAEALATARDLSDRHAEAVALGWLSGVNWQQHAAEKGVRLGEEALRLGYELADEPVIAFSLLNVGIALYHAHQTARAASVLDDCLARYRRLGDTRYIAIAATSLAWVTVEAGEHERAALVLREGLDGLWELGEHRFVVVALRCLIRIAVARSDLRRAVELFGASEALRTSLGMQQTPHAQANDQKLRGSVLARMTVPEFDEAYAAGETMSLDQVLADVVAAEELRLPSAP